MKTIKYILFLLVLCMALSSCEKAPIDNNIEGFWQMESFITKADNKSQPCSRIYYSITRQVAEIATKAHHVNDDGIKGEAFIARFAYEDDHHKIVLKGFTWQTGTGYDGGDVDRTTLLRYGISANPETFTVKVADGKKLVLESDYAILTFKRF